MKKIYQFFRRLFISRTITITKGGNTSAIEADSVVIRNGEHSVKIEVDDDGKLVIHGDFATTGQVTYFHNPGR